MTPCVGICSLHEGMCEGCYRTIDEIVEWRSYSMSQRMEIMAQLEYRKNKSLNGSRCPSCGLENKCAMDLGKSANLCWCMEEKPQNNPIADVGTCYCKRCLKEM